MTALIRARAVFFSVMRARRSAVTRKNNWNRVISPPALSKDTEDKAELCVISTAWVLALGPPRLTAGRRPIPIGSDWVGFFRILRSVLPPVQQSRVSSVVYRELQGAAGGLTESCLCEAAVLGSAFPVSPGLTLSAGGPQHCLLGLPQPLWSRVHRQHSPPGEPPG